jgi:antitoxin component YwqK of YwqJK toxin-antitoxin module
MTLPVRDEMVYHPIAFYPLTILPVYLSGLKIKLIPCIEEDFDTFVERLNEMRKLSLFIVFFLSSILCFSQLTTNKTDANGLKQGKWVSRYPGGGLKYEGIFANNKPVGEWKRYHENGRIKALMSYRLNSERIFASLFDEEGRLYAKGVFDGTLRDSTWNFYSGDQMVLIENYATGKKTGKAKSFDSNGQVMWEKEYKNDLPDGNSIEYYPSGNKKNEIFYKGGKKNGSVVFYAESGDKITEGNYFNDLSDGIWKMFDESGKLKYQVKYNKGEILKGNAIDSLQQMEFKKFDSMKGKIPEPKASESGLPDIPR